MKNNTLRILGLGATLLGFAASILSNYVGDKEIDIKVKEEVAKALTEKFVN